MHPKGTCYFALGTETPTECAFPPPEITGASRMAFDIFEATEGAYVGAGMEAYPMGRNPSAVRDMAEGLEIPWCHAVVSRYRILHDAWLAKLRKERERK